MALNRDGFSVEESLVSISERLREVKESVVGPDVIAELLSVPLEIVFRDVSLESSSSLGGYYQRVPIMSRDEAECFLQLSTLAQEIDAIFNSLERLLLQEHLYKSHNATTQNFPRHSLLRPLDSLFLHFEKLPSPQIRHLVVRLEDIIDGIKQISAALELFSQNNLCWYNDVIGVGASTHYSSNDANLIQREKKKLSELQAELSTRIKVLFGPIETRNICNSPQLGMPAFANEETHAENENVRVGRGMGFGIQCRFENLPSLQVFCNRLFADFPQNQENRATTSSGLVPAPESQRNDTESKVSSEPTAQSNDTIAVGTAPLEVVPPAPIGAPAMETETRASSPDASVDGHKSAETNKDVLKKRRAYEGEEITGAKEALRSNVPAMEVCDMGLDHEIGARHAAAGCIPSFSQSSNQSQTRAAEALTVLALGEQH